jgi:transposase-like protein
MAMTHEEYISHGGSKCPYCESTNIAADGMLEVDGTDAWQDIECEDCGETWQDVFKLVGYEKPNRI